MTDWEEITQFNLQAKPTIHKVTLEPAPIIRRVLARYKMVIEKFESATCGDDYEHIIPDTEEEKRLCSVAEIVLDVWEKSGSDD